MTFPVFPTTLPGLEYPVIRTAEVQGTDLQAMSGRKTWLPNWPWPLYHYELSFSVLRGAAAFTEWQTLLGFWNSVKTAPGGYFYYSDPNDNAVTAQGIGTGDGSTTAFQCYRALGGFVEPILGAINSGAVFKVNGTPASATVDQTTGIVTFSSAPANASTLTWTGSYYWICQFEDTSFELSNFMSQYFEAKKLKFQTARF